MRRRAQRKPSHSRDPRQAAGSSAAYPRFPDKETWLPYGYVAELGAAFLCADLGITPDVREDHAAYIASWLKVLQDDKRLIVSAASHAQRAVDYLHGLQAKAGDGIEARQEPHGHQAQHTQERAAA
jgi:antirestriction protein ArdC